MSKRQLNELDILDEDFLDDEDEEDLDEANMTANMDGGAGPPRTPHAFSAGKKSDKAKRDANIKASGGYTIAPKTSRWTIRNESAYRKMMREMYLNEGCGYTDEVEPEPKKMESPKKRVHENLKSINRQLREIEREINSTAKLRKEAGLNSSAYWSNTRAYLYKVTERISRLSETLKDLI